PTAFAVSTPRAVRPPHPPLFPYTTLFRSPSGARSGSRSWPQPSKTGFSPATPGLNQLAPAELVEAVVVDTEVVAELVDDGDGDLDRKSTRLNSSHVSTSYAVVCLKQKTTR